MCSPHFELLVNCLKFEGVMNMMNRMKSAGVASPICWKNQIESILSNLESFEHISLSNFGDNYLNTGAQELFPSENELWSSKKPEHQNDKETEHDR